MSLTKPAVRPASLIESGAVGASGIPRLTNSGEGRLIRATPDGKQSERSISGPLQPFAAGNDEQGCGGNQADHEQHAVGIADQTRPRTGEGRATHLLGD